MGGITEYENTAEWRGTCRVIGQSGNCMVIRDGLITQFVSTVQSFINSLLLFLVSRHSWRARFARMESLSSQVAMEDEEA